MSDDLLQQWRSMLQQSRSPGEWFLGDEPDPKPKPRRRAVWAFIPFLLTDAQRGYVVGFYSPSDEWQAIEEYADKEEAARRVNYLNGGNGAAYQT